MNLNELLIEPDQRRLFCAIVGLSADRALVRGIGTKIIAQVAGIEDHRAVTPLAEALAANGLIAFERGAARTTHSYRIVVDVPEQTRARCIGPVRDRLQLALRAQRAKR